MSPNASGTWKFGFVVWAGLHARHVRVSRERERPDRLMVNAKIGAS
jgi:hypothetical protein